MPNLTKSQLIAECELARQRGFMQGREHERKLIAEDMKKLREDTKLKILNGIGQCFEAQSRATESLARFVDNYNCN